MAPDTGRVISVGYGASAPVYDDADLAGGSTTVQQTRMRAWIVGKGTRTRFSARRRENKSVSFLVRAAYSGVELITYMAWTAAGAFLEKRPNQ